MDNALVPWRTTSAVAAVIAGANFVVLAAGHLFGADMRVAQTAGAVPTQIGVGPVLLMSILPAVLGGLALWLAARRGPAAWRAVGWLGLALGVLTVPMPFMVQASTGTSITLASMHLVAGVLWLIAVRRAATHLHDRPVVQLSDAA